jgi:hypothetical protein
VFVIWILFELAIEIFGSIFLEMILAVTRVLDEDEGAKVPSAFLLSMVGVVLGALSVVLAPSRLFSSRLLPGASLLIVPVVLGLAMEGWGRLRANRSKNVSHLGTWYGGGALGAGLAVVVLLPSRSVQM